MNNFSHYFMSENFFDIRPDHSRDKSPLYGAGWVIKVNIVLKLLLKIVFQLIVYLQIFEWHSVGTLLSWQSSKTDREIYEDNRTDNFKLSYLKTEIKILKVFRILGVLYAAACLATLLGTLFYARVEFFLATAILKAFQIVAIIIVFGRLAILTKS